MKNLFYFLVLTLSLAVHGATVVLIPGAASSAGTIAVSVSDEVLGRWDQFQYFNHLQNALEAAGHSVEVCPRLPDNDQSSINERAQDCREFIAKMTSCKRDGKGIVLVGHSLGGLVGRRLLAWNQTAKCVRALVTISTPHRGTPLADVLRGKGDYGPFRTAAAALGFHADRPDYVAELLWNSSPSWPNWRGVPIYSITNHAEELWAMPPFKWTGAVLDQELAATAPFMMDRRHDGIVPSASMRFGTHLGHIEANHLDSACALQGQWSEGCKQLQDILTRFLSSVPQLRI